MTKLIPKIWWFLAAYVLAVILYWPALSGTPIWDDMNFWFSDPNMRLTYGDYWLNFAWPFSVSLQKLLLGIFRKDYYLYHGLNLLLHFANSWLVYKLARYLRLRYSIFLFALFLLHPAAVLTTAWMIQIKTLLCFFFALSSFLLFLKGHRKRSYMVLAWFAFLLSILSKSASLTLPVIFLAFSLKKFRFRELYWLIPFFLISSWGAWKLLRSQVTREGSLKAAQVSQVKENDTRSPLPLESVPVTKPEALAPTVTMTVPSQAPEKVIPTPPVNKTTKAVPARKQKPKETFSTPAPKESPLPRLKPDMPGSVPAQPVPVPPTPFEVTPRGKKLLSVDFGFVAQTLNYYFWQSLVPHNNIPVRGLNYQRFSIIEIIHLIFLFIMVLLFWKDAGLYYLAAGHFLLLPFLGFIPAPYMNVTWVSDQHLYLVLPALLAFWFRMLEKIPGKYVWPIPALILCFFSWKTREATPVYKDQFVFYEKCLEYNPYNVPMAYNLAFSRIMKGELGLANHVLKEAFELAEKEPIMKRNYFYPYLAQLHISLKYYLESHAR